MYYRSLCLFFRNTVRSASSCFRVRQDHYGARGLWPDHARARGLWPDHARARGLARPLRALGLLARPLRAPTTSITSRAAPLSSDHVSGTFVGRSLTCARGLPRSLSDHGSGTSSLTPRPWLRDFVARSSTCARGLPRPLSDHSSGTSRLDYMRLHIVGIFFSFRPCYKAHTSPSSKLGDYIETMHQMVHAVPN